MDQKEIFTKKEILGGQEITTYYRKARVPVTRKRIWIFPNWEVWQPQLTGSVRSLISALIKMKTASSANRMYP